jgi:hypothetical protein
MNESHTHSDLSEEVAALRRQVFMLLLALVVISGTLVAYLYYQSRITSKNIEAIKPQATKIHQNFTHDLPMIQSFVKQISAYGAKNPDFAQQVLKNYGIAPQAATSPAAAPKK